MDSPENFSVPQFFCRRLMGHAAIRSASASGSGCGKAWSSSHSRACFRKLVNAVIMQTCSPARSIEKSQPQNIQLQKSQRHAKEHAGRARLAAPIVRIQRAEPRVVGQLCKIAVVRPNRIVHQIVSQLTGAIARRCPSIRARGASCSGNRRGGRAAAPRRCSIRNAESGARGNSFRGRSNSHPNRAADLASTSRISSASLGVIRSSASSTSTQGWAACGIAQFLKSEKSISSRSITRQPPSRPTISSVPSVEPESATRISSAIARADSMHGRIFFRSFLAGIKTVSLAGIMASPDGPKRFGRAAERYHPSGRRPIADWLSVRPSEVIARKVAGFARIQCRHSFWHHLNSGEFSYGDCPIRKTSN